MQRAGCLHIPADSGSSSLITTLTCHSMPLSIIWAAKHRRFPTRWGSAVTTSIAEKCPNVRAASAKKTFYGGMKETMACKEMDHKQVSRWASSSFHPLLPFLPHCSADKSPVFPLLLYGKYQCSHGLCNHAFFPPMCDYSGESGIVCCSGRMPHWGTAAGKASALTFKCELNL